MKIGRSSSGEAGQPDERPDDATALEPWVRCRACGARVAPERARTSPNGSHEHEFTNPSGLRFVISCFAEAPGCVGEGDASMVWTWFPGRAWRIALCRGCGVHLGWSFEKEAMPPFFGLVKDRLVAG